MKTKMPTGYKVLWLVMTAAYAVWMIFFMKPDTYPPAETGMTNPIFYPIWVALSCVFLLLFIFYISRLLYSEKVGKGMRIFSLISLIFGCAFITWYGFFKNPFEFTASMIGLEYPWHFKMWGIFASLSVFCNTLLMYRKYDYYSRAGVICGSVGSAAIFVTINVPSAGEDLILTSLRCMSHWTGALLFAFLAAAPVVIFLISMAKRRNKKFTVLLVAFAAILITMLVLLVVVGKNGVIESLPMWAAYLLLFLVNYTGLFNIKPEAKAIESKQKAAVK